MPEIKTGLNSNPFVGKAHRQSNSGPWVEIVDVECIRETEKAVLIFVDDHSEWIPKSHIGSDSEIWKMGRKGRLIISEWIAAQKNLIGPAQSTKPAADSKLELVEPYKLYRQLARKYHPDMNHEPWAVEVMKDLSTLWHEILKAGGKR